MLRISFATSALLTLSWTLLANAQSAPAAAPHAPSASGSPASPIPNNLAPPPSKIGVGPEAPVGQVTLSLEKQLQDMARGNGLTADEVARRAVSTSALLEAKRRSLEAADATVTQNQMDYLPQITGTAYYQRVSKINLSLQGELLGQTTQPDGTVVPLNIPFSSFVPKQLDYYGVQASIVIPISDYLLRTSYAVAASKRSKNAAQIDEQATRLAVARDARVAYYRWIFAQGAAYVGMQALEQAQGHLTDTRNSWNAGLVSKADVLRAESAAKAAELFAERTKNAVIVATEQLRTLTHDQPGATYAIGENILIDQPPLPPAEDLEKAYEEAVAKRLELRVLEENAAGLREQADAVRSARYPRLDGKANIYFTNPNQRYFPPDGKPHETWDAGVFLTVTPSNWFGVSAAGRALDARAAEVAAQRSALRDNLRVEVSQALIAAREADFALESTRQALAASEESYRSRRELFRAGKATLVEVTDAETDLTRARLDVVNAHVDARIARVQLDHALGRDAK